MFVGHYGPSFAARAFKKSIPLWVLFLSVQLLDVLWAIFVFLGIERVRIVPGITATNPLDLFYMPYTHSLVAAFLWAAIAGAVYRVFRADEGWPAAIFVGGTVFSHWVLDFIVHRPDLPLYDDSFKVGLGVWNFPLAALTLEVVLLFGGMSLYLQATSPTTAGGRYGMLILGVMMLALQVVVFFGPPPSSSNAAAATALVLYFVFAAGAYWLEGKRAPQGVLQEDVS